MQDVVTNTIVGIGKPISKFIGKPLLITKE